MKKIMYILMFLLWFSCANETKNKSLEVATEEAYEIPIIEPNNDDSKVFNYETLASKKLMDYFELVRLRQEHPEFKKDITLQLQNLFHDTFYLTNYQHVESITNIKQMEEIIKISDSVQKIKLYFDVNTDNKTYKDSTLAIITTKSVIIDGDTLTSTKVAFEKIK